MMPTLYVMIGPAGSGKSTMAKTIPFACRVCPDSIRREWFGDEACQKEPEKVFERAYKTMEDLLCAGFDVIFDATNTTAFARKRLLNRVDGITCRKVAVYMNTPLNECKRRNAKRERRVPDDVIERQYAQMLKDSGQIPSLFDEIVVVNW